MSESDHQYFNYQFNGVDQKDIPLSNLFIHNIFPPILINETRNFPVLKNVDDYYMSINRFRLPCNTIPLFHYFNTGELSITLSYGGTDVKQPLIVTGITNIPVVVGSVYTYDQFMKVINTAFTNAFTTLSGSVVLPVTVTEAPYITYTASTQSFSLVVQKSYGTNNVTVWISSELFPYLSGFYFVDKCDPGTETQGKYARWKIYDNKNNSFDATHYELKSEYSNFAYWLDNIFIAITTPGNLPIASENIATNESGGKPIQENIIVDFIPNIQKAQDSRKIQYYINDFQEYRLSDTVGSGELRKMDLAVSYYDKEDAGTTGSQLHSVGLLRGEVFDAKLMMRKVELGIK